MKVECPRCHTRVEKPLQGDPVCPTCGFGATSSVGTPVPTAGQPASGTAASTGAQRSDVGGADAASGIASGAGQGLSPAAGGAAGQAGAPAAGGAWGSPEGWSGAPTQPPNQTLAIVALVLGIVGCCVFQLAGIAAIIVGAIALKRIREDPQQYGGRGMALTGLILGIIGVVAGIIILIVVFSWYLPLLDFCQDNPDDARCEGIQQSTIEQPRVVAQSAATSWGAPPSLAGLVFAVPWRHGT